jgi:hypothetical protein
MYLKDYDNSTYIDPVVQYNDLDNYHNCLSNSPPTAHRVPSMKFPTILDQHPISSPNVLTYQTTDKYPNVEKAYHGPCEQKYFIGKCPSNDFVRDFDVSGKKTVTTPKPVKENMSSSQLKKDAVKAGKHINKKYN